jgi:serine/threonine-protein kinase
MSPEQASGEEVLDARSDVYSLGCVLYEMLAGEPPFTGPSPAAVLARQVQERLPSLEVVRPNLPKALVAAVEKALAKVPADRHQTATEFSEAIGPGPAEDVAPTRKRHRFGANQMVAAAAIFLLALLGADRLLQQCGGAGTFAVGAPSRIAVTYFTVASQDPALAPLGDALTEHVADALFQLGTLDVVSLNAMRPYKGAELPAGVIEDLGIDAYVEGLIMGTSDDVSVSVQLIEAEGRGHLESRVIEGRAGEPFAILEDLAAEVSGLLREWLGVRVEMAQLQAGTESEQAWNLVQRAKKQRDDGIQLAESGDTVAAERALLEADRILERAEAEDPGYLTPIINRSWIAVDLARLGADRTSFDTAWIWEGIEHAVRALAKDPECARALEVRGLLYDFLASEAEDESESASLFTLAERDLVQATRLDSTRSQAYSRLARIYVTQGRNAEAKLAAKTAYEADPYQTDALILLFRLCQTSLELKEWKEVDRWCREGRDRYPDRPSFASAHLAALAGPEGPAANPDTAWFLAEETLRFLAPHERGRGRPPQMLQVAAVLARAGMPDSARAVLLHALNLPGATGPRVWVQEANARLQLGDIDGALDALRRFVEASPSARVDLPTDWWWQEIWDHPRFLELVDPTGRF